MRSRGAAHPIPGSAWSALEICGALRQVPCRSAASTRCVDDIGCGRLLVLKGECGTIPQPHAPPPPRLASCVSAPRCRNCRGRALRSRMQLTRMEGPVGGSARVVPHTTKARSLFQREVRQLTRQRTVVTKLGSIRERAAAAAEELRTSGANNELVAVLEEAANSNVQACAQRCKETRRALRLHRGTQHANTCVSSPTPALPRPTTPTTMG